MGATKRLMMEQLDFQATAVEILCDAGVIERCERHEGMTLAGALCSGQTRRRYGSTKKSPTETGQLSVGCAHVERLSSVSQPASIVYAGTKVWMPEILATRTTAPIRQ
jgi:hypothetical protein